MVDDSCRPGAIRSGFRAKRRDEWYAGQFVLMGLVVAMMAWMAPRIGVDSWPTGVVIAMWAAGYFAALTQFARVPG